MAGRGPAPKDPGTRRRRNAVPDSRVLPAEGYRGSVPPLPAKPWAHGRWLKATRDWYSAWSRSPMATQFGPVEWNMLQRLAILVNEYFTVPDTKLASEIRLQEAKLGATHEDRLRNRWEIVSSEAPAERPRRERGADPRLRLVSSA